jgi:hypothetical protein
MSAANFDFWSPIPITVRSLKKSCLEVEQDPNLDALFIAIRRVGPHSHSAQPFQAIRRKNDFPVICAPGKSYSVPSLSWSDFDTIPQPPASANLGLYIFGSGAFIASHHEELSGVSPQIWQRSGTSQHDRVCMAGALRAALSLYEELHTHARKVKS